MEHSPDCRLRHGQSYVSKRRRIATSVVDTIHLASVRALQEELPTNATCGSNECLLPIPAEENMFVTSAVDVTVESDDCAPENTHVGINGGHNDFVSDSDGDSIHFMNIDSSDSDSDDSSSDLHFDKPAIGVQLAEWAVDNNITQSALGSLLDILKSYHSSLPTDPRTLLKTPQTYNIKEIVGKQGQGQCCHFGLTSGILELLSLGYTCHDNLVTCFQYQTIG